ncbi:hypothetical protein [Haloferula sp. BvORR071]|uniref:hypothetical protein n=1 Tax=Haloferula sp. BvORR071 TaxID=1396141 RepID=UPI000696F6C5|nr:hypothetical protein [Haloferula sp. BvORR071]
MRGILLSFALTAVCSAERINHEGRILGSQPTVTTPILFNTPQADAVVSAMQIMPRDSAWNEDISSRPLLSNSDAMIARITSDLVTGVNANRGFLFLFEEMNYALVPDNQPTQPIKFTTYPTQSDLDGGASPFGNYPIPTNLPVETWPTGTNSLTLEQWQVSTQPGDRHTIMVMPGTGNLWETWSTRRVDVNWQAANGAKFSLNNNNLRPAGWTSGDAAGLPMFPALVRYDEVQRGMVEHAMRVVVKKSRKEYIYPATHYASVDNTTDPDVPAMGQRLRLKAGFNIPADWTVQEKAVALGLKKYGAFVADNGNFFSISITPDDRYPDGCFDHLRSVAISSFEVIQTTGAVGGPRSAGAPSANAGPDLGIQAGGSASLNGAVTGTAPLTSLWTKYSGPGTVSFGNASLPATSATFSIPGRYVLMLSAADEVHTPAYDAVVVDVTVPINLTRSGQDQIVQFPGVAGQRCRVQRSGDMLTWQTIWDQSPASNAVVQVTHSGAMDLPEGRQFYRVLVGD